MARIRVKISRTVEFDVHPEYYAKEATPEEILAIERNNVDQDTPGFFIEPIGDVVEDIVEVSYVEKDK